MSDPHATGSRVEALPPSERALYEQIPPGEDHIPSHEVFWKLHHFRAFHALERKGLIEVEYGPTKDECYVRRSNW